MTRADHGNNRIDSPARLRSGALGCREDTIRRFPHWCLTVSCRSSGTWCTSSVNSRTCRSPGTWCTFANPGHLCHDHPAFLMCLGQPALDHVSGVRSGPIVISTDNPILTRTRAIGVGPQNTTTLRYRFSLPRMQSTGD